MVNDTTNGAKNMNNANTVNSTSSLKDIAKAIRADIKAAKKAGKLPASVKVAVRGRSFAGGCALDVTVTACAFQIQSDERIQWVIDNPHIGYFDAPEKFTTEAAATLKAIDAIVAPYHWSESDSQTDYWANNFFFHGCDFDYKIEKADKAATIERLGAVETVAEVVELHPAPVVEDLDAQLVEAAAQLDAAKKAHADALKKVEIARLRAQAAKLIAEAAELTASL